MLQQLQTEMMLEKSAQLSLLYEVSRPINASLDWRRTLQAVLDAFIHITEAERGMLLILDPRQRLQIEMTRNATGEMFTEADVQFSYSVVQKALDRGSPILTTNAQIDPRFQGSDSIIAYGLRSIMCVPLIHKNESLGVIYLDNRAKSGIFTQEDVTTLHAFANQAAVAIYNAQEHQKINQALSERVRELTILQEMARDLGGSLQYNRVMERSITWAIAASGAEAGAIGLIAEEGIRWMARVGDVNPDTSIAMHAVYTHKPLMEKQRMVLPLVRDTRPVGVLYLVTEEREFKQNKLEFVVRVADNVAVAVENARLYEALRQANLAKSEFISTVSSELQPPMSAISNDAAMLGNGVAGELSPHQLKFARAISHSVSNMQKLVNDFLHISLIEAGRLKLALHPIPFQDTLNEAIKAIQNGLDEKQQRLTVEMWDGLPPAHADTGRLKQILVNLLSNASKYSPGHAQITVKVWLAAEEPDFIRCAIMDTGIGISRENQPHLFTKFFRADDPAVHNQPGTGLGLTITKHLVEMQGGRIWMKSALGEGSTFFFTIPIAMPGSGGLFA